MTEELFRQDGYVSEFESIVSAVDGDWVKLEGTFFYPGGGGQVCDTGAMSGYMVDETKYDGDKDIVHHVPGNPFKVGDKVWCSVDWDRRYDLMKGHTAEHTLFNSLHRQDPELGIVKIFISPESKYVIVDRDISLEKIRDAVDFANQVIDDNLPVVRSVMSRDDPDLANVRMHLERIEGDEIGVVEIGDVDIAACSGIHVMETSEIEAIFVDRKVSAGKDGYAIHFKIGQEAKNASNRLANTCLQVIDILGSKPEDVVKTVSNMKSELESTKTQLKQAAAAVMKSQQPDTIGEVQVYSMYVPTSDRSVVSDMAEKHKSAGAVSAYVFGSGNLSVIVSSGDKRVDCKKVLGDAMKEFGGRGGGKPDFSQGGVPEGTDADKVLQFMNGLIAAQLN